MTVIDKLNDINSVIKELFDFVIENNVTKGDFQEYLSAMGTPNPSPAQMEKLFIPYAFERNLGEPSKSVIELFNEEKVSNPEVAKSFLNAQYTVFRVEKILKNGFELFNLTNEKQYTVLSLTKMANFRGLAAGEFIVARIFKFRDEYYLIGIDNMLASHQIKEAIRYAIVKIVQSPWLVYQDNKEKEDEIIKDIELMSKKFEQIFNSDEFITTNKYADSVIALLNDEETEENFDIEKAKEPLKTYKFFPIKELQNTYDNFIENSLGGFSSHSETYDVGIIFDKELGLYSVPFYQTFCNIFEGKDVENAKDCVVYFLKNDGISDKIIRRIADKYSNFIEKINELLESDYTIDTLLQAFKSDFLKRKIYSSTSVLYHSSIFSASIDMIETEQKAEESTKEVKTVKVGRNELCPCGSGKKYKHCCMK